MSTAAGLGALAGRAAIVAGPVGPVGSACAAALEREGARVRPWREGEESPGDVDLLVVAPPERAPTPVTDPWEKALRDWDAHLDGSLRATLRCARACVPTMLERGRGDIVLVSAHEVLSARDPDTYADDADVWAASVWALNGLTQAWGLALRRRGIRVNALCPGEVGPDAVAGALLALLREGPEGRTGQNVPVPSPAGPAEEGTLPPPWPRHRAVTG